MGPPVPSSLGLRTGDLDGAEAAGRRQAVDGELVVAGVARVLHQHDVATVAGRLGVAAVAEEVGAPVPAVGGVDQHRRQHGAVRDEGGLDREVVTGRGVEGPAVHVDGGVEVVADRGGDAGRRQVGAAGGIDQAPQRHVVRRGVAQGATERRHDDPVGPGGVQGARQWRCRR